MKLDKDLENRFTYHKPTSEQVLAFPVIREQAKTLAYLIKNYCPSGREQSLALTKLEETVMWANAGIARGNAEAETGLKEKQDATDN